MGEDAFDWMISVDDHVIEPPHVWHDRLPAKYRDLGPRVVRDDAGEAWVYEDARVPTTGVTGTVSARRKFRKSSMSRSPGAAAAKYLSR